MAVLEFENEHPETPEWQKRLTARDVPTYELVPGQMLDEYGNGLTNLTGHPVISPDFEAD